MAYTVGKTKEKREEISDLDLNDPYDYEVYDDIRYEYIKAGEGYETQAYDDARSVRAKEDGEFYVEDLREKDLPIKGNITVGIGFNMGNDHNDKGKARKEAAKKEWGNAYKNSDTRPDFDNIYRGNSRLNKDNLRDLYNDSIDDREHRLKIKYGGNWDKLKPNEKLAIEDLNYNSESLVHGRKNKDGSIKKGSTNFYKNIDKYTKTDDEKHLDAAIWEVKENSNKEKMSGINNRRKSQAEMLNTKDRDLDEIITPDYEAEKARKEAEDELSELEKELPSDEEIEGVAQEVADANKQDQKEKIEQTCGVEPAFDDQEKVDGMTTAFVADHKQNIQTIADDIRLKIQNTIDEAIYSARTSNQILAEVDLILNGFLSRAGRMNDGIIMNFNAQLSKSRQTSFGITRYIWRSSDDDKVREGHAHNDDQVHNWEEGEIPGEDYNCRCEAEPICPDDDEEIAA